VTVETRREAGEKEKEPMAESVKDPVCGMTVDPKTAAAHVDHAGTTYHFCSQGCAERFKAEPSKYAK
jgi:Cu+-exporting ATPase